ncbi:hypothetical protein RGR602_PC02283 (plasmid) [Rhizobium gallicum bv. gallicum R602sp]|uniref:Uncharacterized protein n=1 Tax=Rhizobium gallicum bv. gallicum R602sp TaxID=1041138 RepID=A0A0B4XIR9_9HYPH|nr:hypothetical protein RGR602_PC02283 [Rhizobium gallicum bv. gallicum R602sp]
MLRAAFQSTGLRIFTLNREERLSLGQPLAALNLPSQSCGDIVQGTSIEPKRREMYRYIVATALGERPKSEQVGFW